jgi:CPA1 family monovalent cation:H+ antiporter
MALFQVVIALLLVGAVLSLWAERIAVPYPALLAIAGAALALLPATPQVSLDPQLALALFVAPVLLDAAYDVSPRDLGRNFKAVTSLAVVAVALTIIAVAAVVRQLVPDMSWSAAITLGAIVAPPDASAATAVLRRLRPPHRLMVILEGESLFNDASALLVYRFAVAVATGGVFHAGRVLPLLLLTCGGGIFLGHMLARLYLTLTRPVQEIPTSILLQFIGTFAVWLLAEALDLSAILTVIAYAMTLARHGGPIGARHRISSYAVWDVVVFVMNVLAFVLIGLQLQMILRRPLGPDWYIYLVSALAVCATVILVRMVWVNSYHFLVRWRLRLTGPGPWTKRTMPTAGGGLVISWCGMRGIVTLATALALPHDFPHRDLVILCAFSVVLCTLVLQGMTLRPLIQRLGLKDDGTVEHEIRVARGETALAALRSLEQEPDMASCQSLRRDYEARLRLAQAKVAAGTPTGPSSCRMQRRAIAAQREALSSLRRNSVIGDDAFHAIEEEIDLIELTADDRIRPPL